MHEKFGFASLSWKSGKSWPAWKRMGLRARSERGAALVEFAVVLPLFMLVTTGIFSFGFAINNYLQLTNAVTMAAEQLAISPNAIADPCATVTSVIDQAAPFLKAANVTTTTSITTGSATQVTTSYSGSSCPAGAALLANSAGDPVEVTAQYPCTLHGYGFNFNCALKAQVTEMAQ